MTLLLYQFFLWLYKLGAGLAMGFNPKVRKWVQGRHGWQRQWKQKLEKAEISADSFVIWMHAASLGEFEQGSPVLESLSADYPHAKIVVTFFSPSGYEVRKDYRGAHATGYLPFDGPLTSPAFVQMLNPSLVLWVKYEYWYYVLQALHQRQIPLLLVSGTFRPSAPFFKWYGSMHRKMLQFFSHCFVQQAADAALIKAIVPAHKITVSGDTRFDAVSKTMQQWQAFEKLERWLGSNSPVVVAGSTWPSDEEELVHFVKTHTQVKWVIAPHDVAITSLNDTLALFEHPLQYSQLDQPAVHNQRKWPHVLVIDNVGMLRFLYRYASICYVGGGFTGSGIHNVLEAAVYGKPVIHGPEYQHYAEAIGLLETGGSVVVNSGLELEAKLDWLLQHPEEAAAMGTRAAGFVANQKGATAAIVQWVQENLLLTSEIKR